MTEAGVQAAIGVELLDSCTQYEDINGGELITSTVPDVVPFPRQTVDASSQYECSRKDSSSQHTVVQKDSGSQHTLEIRNVGSQHSVRLSDFGIQQSSTLNTNIHKQTTDSSCQYESSVTDSSTQHAPVVRESSTQHKLSVKSISCQVAAIGPPKMNSATQHVCQVKDSTCQSETVSSKETSCQQDFKTSADVSSQCNADVSHAATQYHTKQRNCHTMTNLHFRAGESLPLLGQDIGDGSVVKLEPVAPKVDKANMTNRFFMSSDRATSTIPVAKAHRGTHTESVKTINTAVDPILQPVSHSQSQTISTSLRDVSTGTPALITSSKDVETNTNLCITLEKSAQTSAEKMKSRGILARPSLAEFGVNVKPCSSNSFTNTDVRSVGESQTQTTGVAQVHKSINTSLPAAMSKGVMARISGVNCQTSTEDLVYTQGLSTQTEHHSSSVCVGTEAMSNTTDISTNTVELQHETTACGADTPIDNTTTIGVGTAPPPSLREIGINATQTKSDSWTNPVLQPVSSKACGTERIKHRNVGLYVRPLSVDNASMTVPKSTRDRGCGPEEQRLQNHKMSDTQGLVRYSDKHSNTNREYEILYYNVL